MKNSVKYIIGMAVIAGLLMVLGCEKYWDEHYGSQPETVNENVWEAVQKQADLSSFVGYIKEFRYDTLFLNNDSYTLFIPDNDAFTQFIDTGEVNTYVLDYHISEHFIQSGNIQGKRKVQTLGEKFVMFEKFSNAALFDGIQLAFESPLYLNGKFFTMEEVAIPRPNLYEFFTLNNPILKGYIDEHDSLILDKEKSRPLGFDENGNTIYDSVTEVVNTWEWEFFPVSEELRHKTATIVFPLQDDYEAALTIMAEALGGSLIDYNDIPIDWQYDVLIPHLVEHGVFENQLEEIEFVLPPNKDTLKLKNILGDSVVVTYTPVEKTMCSNGYAYNYADFTIPDSLYSGSSVFEGEWLLKTVGLNKYAWKEEVTVITDIPFEAMKELIPAASNDSILKVNFPKGYDGIFTVEFNTENMFPGKYLMVVSTHMDIGGIYEIYVNDELVCTMDYYDYVLRYEIWPSVAGDLYAPRGRYVPEGRFNKFDCFVESIREFGEAKIRIEYKGPGRVASNGLVIDFIEFVPVPE
jgi:hypothetical protein